MKEISRLHRTDTHLVQMRSQTLHGSINSANKIGAPCNINFQRRSAHSVNYSAKKKGPSKVRTRTQCLQCKIANQERKKNTFFSER